MLWYGIAFTMMLSLSGCGLVEYESEVGVYPSEVFIQPDNNTVGEKSLWNSVPLIEPIITGLFSGVAELSKFSPTNKALEPKNNKVFIRRRKFRLLYWEERGQIQESPYYERLAYPVP